MLKRVPWGRIGRGLELLALIYACTMVSLMDPWQMRDALHRLNVAHQIELNLHARAFHYIAKHEGRHYLCPECAEIFENQGEPRTADYAAHRP